jgi:hypothetical protein
MDRFTVNGLLLAAAFALIGVWFYVRDSVPQLDRVIAPWTRELPPAPVAADARDDLAAEAGVPDLVVLDLCYEGPYVTVTYANLGTGVAEDDFLVKLSTQQGEFGGNSYYRFEVPPPQHVMHTGGFTIGLIGLEQGDNEVVTAEIDWEGRVAESNEDNNVHSKQLLIDATQPTAACM